MNVVESYLNPRQPPKYITQTNNRFYLSSLSRYFAVLANICKKVSSKNQLEPFQQPLEKKFQQEFCRSSKYLREHFQQILARTVLANARKKVSAGILPFQQKLARTVPAKLARTVLAKTCPNCPFSIIPQSDYTVSFAVSPTTKP